MDLQQLILLALRISIFLMVLAIGLRATFADSLCLFRRPRDLWRAFLSMNVVMPICALILALTFNLNPAVKIALVALSVSPVPPIFPRRIIKTGKNEDYAVGLLVAAAVLSIIVIPITIEIVQRVTGVPVDMTVSAVAGLVIATILAPLLVGISVRTWAPAFAERVANPTGVVALTLLLLGTIPVLFVSMRTILSLIGNGTLLSLSVFAVVGLLAGHFLGGPEPGERRVLALATATRHPGMAVAIAQANFPQQKLAVPAIVLYLLVSGILSALYPRPGTQARPASTATGTRAAA